MIEIIPYSEGYKEDVIDLIVNIWENEFSYKGLKRPDIRDIPMFYQGNEDSNFWLALYRKTLVGTIGLIRQEDGSGHLKRMAVQKEFRKQGTGEKLFQTMLEFAKNHRIKTIYAGMVPENTNAIEFYKKRGFVESNFTPEGIVISDQPVCLKLDL